MLPRIEISPLGANLHIGFKLGIALGFDYTVSDAILVNLAHQDGIYSFALQFRLYRHQAQIDDIVFLQSS